MQQEQKFGGQNGRRDQFTSWINDAPPEDAIAVARQALGRVAKLDQTHRDRFVSEIGKDPALARLFEDLKTPA